MKRMHYLDVRTARPPGGIDQIQNEEHRRDGLRCRDGCGGIPTEWEGKPATLRFVRKPSLTIEAAPRAEAMDVEFWKILKRHLPSAVVGSIELLRKDGSVVPVPNYVSVYLPVLDRVCLRGLKKYDVCKSCGAVRCKDFGVEEYLLRKDVDSRRVVMSMSRGILVDDAMRETLEKKKFKGLRFYKYEVFDEPRDGRPQSLDDWPELAKWRRKRRKK